MNPTSQTNPAHTHRRRVRIFATYTALIVWPTVVSASPPSIPPFNACQMSNHPPAADLVPLLSPLHTPAPEVLAVLAGEVTVGTDCSIYESPV